MRPQEDEALEPYDDEDLLIVLPLTTGPMGSHRERQDLEQFGDRMEAAVVAAEVGEFDGHEIGGGECVLFFAGASAQAILDVLRPMIQGSAYVDSARVRIQQGDELIEAAL